MSNIHVYDIREVVGEHFGLTKAQMVGKKRTRSIARPRQMAMALSREMTGVSLPTIALQFHKDHTTVLHAMRQVAQLERADPAFADVMNKLRAAIRAHVFVGPPQKPKPKPLQDPPRGTKLHLRPVTTTKGLIMAPAETHNFGWKSKAKLAQEAHTTAREAG